VVFGHTVPGPLMAEGAAGTSLAINLLVAPPLEVGQVLFDPDAQMFPWRKFDATFTVMMFVPAPDAIDIPVGIVQL